MSRSSKPLLTNGLLRSAYENGLFPMAEGGAADAPLYWYQPDPRAVITPESFHITSRLGRLVRTKPFDVVWDDDFRTVMEECGANRPDTWINPEMVDAYTEWARAGDAHCLSVFKDGKRVGGLYGVQIGGIFCAESMFSRVPNASSVGLVVLVAGLWHAGIELIDVQFRNPHTDQFGVKEIAHIQYMKKLVRLKTRDVILRKDYFSLETAVSLTQSFNHTS